MAVDDFSISSLNLATRTEQIYGGVQTVSRATDEKTGTITETQNLMMSNITYDQNGQVTDSRDQVTGTLVHVVA